MRLCSDSNMYETLTTFSGNVSVDLLGTVNLGNQFSATIADAGASFVGGAVAMGIGSIAAGSAAGAVTSTTTIGSRNTTTAAGTTKNEENITTTNYSTGIGGSLPRTNFNVQSATGQFSGAGSVFLTNTPAAMIIYAQCYMPYTLGSYTDYCNMYGYPCNRYLKIGDCTGYIQAVGASVQGAAGATPSNLATINSFLNSGFYYE